MEGSAYMGYAEALMEAQVYKPGTAAHGRDCTTAHRCSTIEFRPRSTRPRSSR
jgi:hypothetical protein